MTRTRLEASKLLEWLAEVFKNHDGIDVDVLVEASGHRSSLQIIVRDVPGPIAGLEVRSRPVRLAEAGDGSRPR